MQGTPAPPAPVIAAPRPGAPDAAAAQVIQMPTTRRQLDMIEMQRQALSDQLISAQRRRNDVQAQINRATSPADRAGVENRLGVLDNRIAQLERDIDVTGRQVSSPEAAAIRTSTTGGRVGNLSPGQVTGLGIVGLLTIGLPMSIAFARVIWRRARLPAAPADRELTRRLDRMDEGIDAIAIEVERISEGQRFVTKLLGEGAAQPVRVGGGEPAAAVRSSRTSAP